ncbi:serine protease inhibitor I/II-like isoform X2 [Tribolium madens]|uniref:serine protease inhibitor I/II-like isoform X2 n=1 Tax=Tribolium madens TaxID=41895 RepID=UPI001CF73B28|nr:serine protease inhibitor I/II-like isoform X2 [Tribolium madens]
MKTIIVCCFMLCILISSIILADAQWCIQGEKKKIDCNFCHCNFGRWVCTRRACLPDEITDHYGNNPTEDRCKQGERKMKKCNRCHCSRDNVWVCTKMFCYEDDP